VLVTPNARLIFKKTRTNENTGAPWAYVFISRIIHARNHVKKNRKKMIRSISKIDSKLISRSELPHFTVPVQFFYLYFNLDPCRQSSSQNHTVLYRAILCVNQW
jgi:hypothetical protein